MKKNKLRKKILILSTFGIVSAFSVCTGMGLLNVSISNTNTDKDIKKVGTSLNALDTNSSTTNQTKAAFSVKTPTTILNKTADKVLNSDIEAILTPSSAITNFSVVILPITQKNINEGYVNFLVFETYQTNENYKTELADASSSKDSNSSSSNYQSDDTIDSATLNKYANSSSSSVSATNVFSTKKITSLSSVGDNKEPWITPEKYTLSWASDDYLKQYITNKTTDLTIEDVWNNFFSENNYLPPLKNTSTDSKDSSTNSDQYTDIKVTKVNIDGTDSSSNTGIYKVVVSIYNTTKDSWTSEPTTSTSSSSPYTITKYFGGFLKSDGTRDNISINIEQSIGSWTIPNLSTFYYGSSETNKTVNSLAASEFINPVGGTSALISMFDSGTGLKKLSSETTSTPIITYKFNGNTYNFYNSTNNNSSNDSGTNSSNGILGEIQKNNQKIKITNIQAIPDDSTGSLKLIFYYNGYSIYSDSVVPQIYTYTYPAGTFAVSSNPDQNSIFTWKNVNTLSDDGLSTSYDIVNEFNKNKDNTEFVRLFTNQFLDASSDILDMPRTAIITYGTNTSEIKEPSISPSTNDYSSDTSSTSICIQLTFNNWSKQEKSKTFVTSYTFPNYKYTYNSTSNSTDDSLTLSWKTSSDVIKENPSYAATSPSEIVYNLLSNSNILNSYTKFFTGTSLNSSQLAVSYLPDNTNGTILVYVSRRTDQNSGSSDSSTSQLNAHVYSQLFVGFKKSASSGGIMSYSWLPQDDVSLELLSIPLSRVTKADVMKYYLDNISLFKDRTLTEDDVEIIPDINSSSLTVKVTIDDFNKDDTSLTSSNKTFLTKITGFVSSTHTNDTVFSPPKNLTAVISVSAATLISVTLGIVLCGMLIRRARIRDFKGYHGSVLNGDKQKKENKNKKKKII